VHGPAGPFDGQPAGNSFRVPQGNGADGSLRQELLDFEDQVPAWDELPIRPTAVYNPQSLVLCRQFGGEGNIDHGTANRQDPAAGVARDR